MLLYFPFSISKAITSTEAYTYEAKLSATCTLIREPNEVAKIVLEKEAQGMKNGAGVEMNLNDHDINEEIKRCSQNGGYSGPFQFASAAISKYFFDFHKSNFS